MKEGNGSQWRRRKKEEDGEDLNNKLSREIDFQSRKWIREERNEIENLER